jgi:DNA-3-methyladenine glycosylase
MHYCCNVVTGREGEGNAVLLRAMEPLEGIETMMRNRFGESKKDFRNLTNGPAKICRAFGIDSKDNGVDLLGDDIYILDGETVSEDSIHVSRRIGIKKSTDLPWRFYIKENPFVSKK